MHLQITKRLSTVKPAAKVVELDHLKVPTNFHLCPQRKALPSPVQQGPAQ